MSKAQEKSKRGESESPSYKVCAYPCKRSILHCDTNSVCVACLGSEHAAAALERADCSHCELMLMRVLRSQKALFEEGAFTSVSRGAGPTRVEVGRRKRLWESQIDLVQTEESLSSSSSPRSGAAQGGKEACDAVTSTRQGGTTLLLSSSEELNQVLEELSIDTLLTSDWTKLEKLVKLLEPFAIHTDQLQNDSQSLSQVVPCLLNPEAHLLTTTAGKQLAQVLLKSLQERFSAILSPDSPQFDATPAAACLMDPSVSLVLQTPDTVPLRRAAQSFVQNLAATQNNLATASQDDVATASASQTPTSSAPTVLQKYRFLPSRMEVNVSLTNQPDVTNSLVTEINKYVDDVKHGVFNETPLQYWRSRTAVYPKLAPVALDFVSAPASQAFVERIFSVCGLLSSGLRNHIS